jgi:predicted metal-dependent hydrolase
MSAKNTAQGITGTRPDPAFSQLINGTSILLPYMEPFIIDAIRQTSQLITDVSDKSGLDNTRK